MAILLNPPFSLAQLLFSRRAFVAFAVSLVAYNVGGTLLLDVRGHSDLWEHLAAIRALATDPLDPSHPHLPTQEPTHLFTPYHLVWALVARIARVQPFWLLPLMAGLNITVFFVGCKAVTTRILRDERYALILSATLLFFWIQPWEWSGFYHFALLPLTSAYPYWLALGLTMLITAYADKPPSWPLWLAFAVGSLVVFVSHPLTGVLLCVSLFARWLALLADHGHPSSVTFLAPVVGIAAGAFAWPYFSVYQTIAGSSTFTALGFAGDWRDFYEQLHVRLLPAALGVPLLVSQLTKPNLTYASIGLAITGALWVFNGALVHSPALARLVIYVVFFAQLGLVMTLMRLERREWFGHVLTAFVVVAALLAVPQGIDSMKRIGAVRDATFGDEWGTNSNLGQFVRYGRAAEHLNAGSVVMAPLAESWELPGLLGCKVVATINPTPFSRDYEERLAAVEAFYRPFTSSSDRAAILSRWGVTHVLVASGNSLSPVATMEAVHHDEWWTLYEVNRGAGAQAP